MLKNSLRMSLLLLSLLIAPFALAHGDTSHMKEATIVGEVIDSVCYVHHDSRGKDHEACARYCAEKGINLAILDEKTDKIYLSLPIDHTNPNAKLMDFIAKRVKVTGVLLSKGGLNGIHVVKVELAE